MTINLSVPRTENELKPRITVIGVGGAGGNAVNNMIRSNLEGVEFLVTNTDAQALAQSSAERKIQLGVGITRGLGAGARPEVGREAAEEAMSEIIDQIDGSHMVFITAGMGGGTGTGAAPVIARAAREHGILTVGVVTKPFHFEGSHRMRIAEQGIEDLTQFVDTLIIIPNQNLFRVATEKTTFAEAFKLADDVLYSGVRGVTDLMIMPGLINLDFADIRTVMTEMGKAMMGTGEAEGEKRAIAAAEAAISNPLLDDVSMKGARGVLINITGGPDMTLYEVDEAANRIREEVDSEANIIFGATLDETLEGRIRISMVATGIASAAAVQPRPLSVVGGTMKPMGMMGMKTEQRAPAMPMIPQMAPRPMPMTSGNNALAMAAEPAMMAQPMPSAMMSPEPEAAMLEAAMMGMEEQTEPAMDTMPEPMMDAPQMGAPVAQAPAPRMPASIGNPAMARRPAIGTMGQPLMAQPQMAQPMAAPVMRPAPRPMAPQMPMAERRPAAPMAQAPTTSQADMPFIAPAAAEASEDVPMARRDAPMPDPFAEAAMANGTRAPEKAPEPVKERSSGMNLFKKVTGLGLRRDPAPAKPAVAAKPMTPPSMMKSEPGMGQPQRQGTSTPTQMPAPMAVTPADRPVQSRQDDDLLDIPAFLRRQAN